MKLISLNTWGGKVFEPLMDFIIQHSGNTDIFCLQEIYNTNSPVKSYHHIRANLLAELIKILPDFQSTYSVEFRGYDSCPDSVNFDLTVGKAIFSKDSLKILLRGELLISGDKGGKALKSNFSNLPITLQFVDIDINGKLLTIANLHGTSFPGSKLDTLQRLEQSQKVLDFLNIKVGAKVLTGDFNLLPPTKSIQIFEKELRNLISEYKIERTRSDLNPYAIREDFQKHADYTFVSKDLKVKNFEVPNLKISDHLPMILEFN